MKTKRERISCLPQTSNLFFVPSLQIHGTNPTKARICPPFFPPLYPINGPRCVRTIIGGVLGHFGECCWFWSKNITTTSDFGEIPFTKRCTLVEISRGWTQREIGGMVMVLGVRLGSILFHCQSSTSLGKGSSPFDSRWPKVGQRRPKPVCFCYFQILARLWREREKGKEKRKKKKNNNYRL